MMPLLKQRWLRLTILLILLWWIFSRIDLTLWLRALGGFDLRYAGLMIGIYLLLILLFAWRWQLMGRSLGIQSGYATYIRGLWSSQAMGELGPPLVLGELARFHALHGQGDSHRLILSQLLDRISGYLVLLVLVLLSLPFAWPMIDQDWFRGSAALALGVVAIPVAGFVACRCMGRTVRSHAEAGVDIIGLLRQPGHYLVSAAIQALLICNWVLAAAGLGLTATLGHVALMGPLLLLGLNLLPGLVSDWGKREAAAILLLSPAGLAPEQCLAMSVIFGATHLVTAVPGLLFLGTGRTANQSRADSGE